MLILSRKRGEQIVIGDNIYLTVVAVRGERVRLGFTAPPGVPIVREELRFAGARGVGPDTSDGGVREAEPRV